jgi:hypothetical protein
MQGSEDTMTNKLGTVPTFSRLMGNASWQLQFSVIIWSIRHYRNMLQRNLMKT